MQSHRDLWRTLAIFLVLAIPAALCQDIRPVIPRETWLKRGEALYPWLSPAKPSRVRTDGPVAILEVDKDAERVFGWPLPRQRYAEALDKLKQQGHPWVLSFLQFQSRGPGEAAHGEDEVLRAAIARYGRYVGSSLSLRDDDEPLNPALAKLVQTKALVAKDGASMAPLAELPLAAEEAESVMGAAAQFGVAPLYGTEPVIYCTRHYVADAATGAFVLPTSLLWAAALQANVNFRTAAGPQKTWRANRPYLNVAERHCLSEPRVDTKDQLAARGIEVIPFRDFLADPKAYKLGGKVVILASAKMRQFQGPGAVAGAVGSGVVPEHLLSARFLADMLQGTTVARNDNDAREELRIALFAVTGLLMALSLFTGFGALITLSGACLATLVGVSLFNLNILQVYVIPLSTGVAFAGQLGGLLGLAAFAAYRNAARKAQFADDLRRELGKASEFESLAAAARKVLETQFLAVDVALACENATLYAALAKPEATPALFKDDGALALKDEAFADGKGGVRFTRLGRAERWWGRRLKGEGSWRVGADGVLLGTIEGTLSFYKWEKGLATGLLDAFRREIGLHWRRIDLLTLQRLKDYQAAVNGARSNILGKFLTKHIVGKFEDGRAMEENLREVLTPRRCKAAVMQADIRGYSSFFIDRDPLEVIKLIKSYYAAVVDAASEVAQVKLVGDCIFLFIEETGHEGVKSVADVAVELAMLLVNETVRRNGERKRAGDRGVVFGVAIHYGEVILGNLSSDSCIDYTVVGPNVNRTARMEELTKHEAVKAALGENGILISDEACGALRHYASLPFATMDLPAIGARVRSFEAVTSLLYLRAEQVTALGVPSPKAAPAHEHASAPMPSPTAEAAGQQAA